jgi:cobalt-zinc-cadmium efflux system outer membrane protein
VTFMWTFRFGRLPEINNPAFFMPHFLIRSWLFCALLSAQLHAESVVVTLSSVGDRIRSQNPDLAAARLRIREAVGRAKQSGRLANPELETSFEGKPNSREGNFEIGFSQKFPVTNRLRLEKEISATGIQTAEAEVRGVERWLIAEARQLAVKLLTVRERRALLKQQVSLAGEFAAFLASTAAKGEGSRLDAGQAKLEANSLALELRQIDVEETSLLGELKPLLGLKPGEALAVSGNLPAASPSSGSSDPGKRPDYQVARLEEKAAAANVALEQARRYDDIEGGLFAGAERMEDVPAGYENEALVGLRFKFALPFWNKNEGAIEEAEATRERKQKETAALAANIRLEAEAARAEMSQWAGVLGEIQQTLLPLAEEQATLAETACRNGQGEIQNVLRAREKRLQLAAARLDALREFHLARIRHEAALGMQ